MRLSCPPYGDIKIEAPQARGVSNKLGIKFTGVEPYFAELRPFLDHWFANEETLITEINKAFCLSKRFERARFTYDILAERKDVTLIKDKFAHNLLDGKSGKIHRLIPIIAVGEFHAMTVSAEEFSRKTGKMLSHGLHWYIVSHHDLIKTLAYETVRTLGFFERSYTPISINFPVLPELDRDRLSRLMFGRGISERNLVKVPVDIREHL